METLLLFLSFIALHFSAGLIKEIDRKYKRMRSYGKSANYDFENQITSQSSSITQFPMFGLSLISSLLLSLLPLFKLIDLNWIWLILINIGFSLFVTSWISFIIIPENLIFGKKQFKKISVSITLIGISLYFLSILI
jgi:hypothetical protein